MSQDRHKRDKFNRALDMYNRIKALLVRAHVVHQGPDSFLLVEYRGKGGYREASMLRNLLFEARDEARAEAKAEEERRFK